MAFLKEGNTKMTLLFLISEVKKIITSTKPKTSNFLHTFLIIWNDLNNLRLEIKIELLSRTF